MIVKIRRCLVAPLLWIAAVAAFAGEGEPKRILFLGDSLAAGYGLGKEFAFPALVQKKIDESGLSFRVVNAGVSGDTSAGGLRRLGWVLRQPIDVLVLELGANDGLRGLPVGQTRKNLNQIIERTRRRYPDAAVVIAGMKLPPNLGRAYLDDFEAIFSELALSHQAVLIPFLLEGVAAVPELNLADGIHPTREGHRKVAQTVWRYLEPVLRARSE